LSQARGHREEPPVTDTLRVGSIPVTVSGQGGE